MKRALWKIPQFAKRGARVTEKARHDLKNFSREGARRFATGVARISELDANGSEKGCANAMFWDQRNVSFVDSNSIRPIKDMLTRPVQTDSHEGSGAMRCDDEKRTK
jgi:hypothetical protein